MYEPRLIATPTPAITQTDDELLLPCFLHEGGIGPGAADVEVWERAYGVTRPNS
jgi:hypothetical protein